MTLGEAWLAGRACSAAYFEKGVDSLNPEIRSTAAGRVTSGQKIRLPSTDCGFSRRLCCQRRACGVLPCFEGMCVSTCAHLAVVPMLGFDESQGRQDQTSQLDVDSFLVAL